MRYVRLNRVRLGAVPVVVGAGLLALNCASTSGGEPLIGAELVEQGELDLAAFEALPFVSRVEGRENAYAVDWTDVDPAVVGAALEAASDALDGAVIRHRGLEVLPGPERAKMDNELGKQQAEQLPKWNGPSDLCPGKPLVERSDDGSTMAYLGCDPITGPATWSPKHAGDARDSLTAAVHTVLMALDVNETVAVRVDGGSAVVDLPATVLDLHLHKADGSDLYTALMFTVFSNGAIDEVEFLVDGDCLLFAFAVGGDSCSVVSMDELQ